MDIFKVGGPGVSGTVVQVVVHWWYEDRWYGGTVGGTDLPARHQLHRVHPVAVLLIIHLLECRAGDGLKASKREQHRIASTSQHPISIVHSVGHISRRMWGGVKLNGSVRNGPQ